MGNSQSLFARPYPPSPAPRSRRRFLTRLPTISFSNVSRRAASRLSQRFASKNRSETSSPELEPTILNPSAQNIEKAGSSPEQLSRHSSQPTSPVSVAGTSNDYSSRVGLSTITGGLRKLSHSKSAEQCPSPFSADASDRDLQDIEVRNSGEDDVEGDDIWPSGTSPVQSRRFSFRQFSLNAPSAVRRNINLLQTIFTTRSSGSEIRSGTNFASDQSGSFRHGSIDSTFFHHNFYSDYNFRDSTPSDLEYSHLGRLKLGTLRVVNGSVSSFPSEYVSKSSRHQSRIDLAGVEQQSRFCAEGYLDRSDYSNVQDRHREVLSGRPRVPRKMRSSFRLEHEKWRDTRHSNRSELCLNHARASWPIHWDSTSLINAGDVAGTNQRLRRPVSLDSSELFATTFIGINPYEDDEFDEGVDVSVNYTEKERDSEVAKDSRPRALCKADSGYSSASSQRTSRRNGACFSERSSATEGMDDIYETTNQNGKRVPRLVSAHACDQPSEPHSGSLRRSRSLAHLRREFESFPSIWSYQPSKFSWARYKSMDYCM